MNSTFSYSPGGIYIFTKIVECGVRKEIWPLFERLKIVRNN